MKIQSVVAKGVFAIMIVGLLVACGSPRETVTAAEAQAAAEEAQRKAAQSTAPVNAECPIMSGPVDPARTVIYKNQKVAFCCGDCVVAWLGLTDEERDAALAKATARE